jgi:hypothetical protein
MAALAPSDYCWAAMRNKLRGTPMFRCCWFGKKIHTIRRNDRISIHTVQVGKNRRRYRSLTSTNCRPFASPQRAMKETLYCLFGQCQRWRERAATSAICLVADLRVLERRTSASCSGELSSRLQGIVYRSCKTESHELPWRSTMSPGRASLEAHRQSAGVHGTGCRLRPRDASHRRSRRSV